MTTIHLQMLGSDPIDQGLLNQAVCFFNAGSRCSSSIAITPLIHNSPMAPAVVCFAFSVELYLKLLHVLTLGKPARGHELEKLFAALPDASKDRLEVLSEAKGVTAGLAAASHAFVEWRYGHEHEGLGVNPHFLASVAAACHRYARELRPELRVFGETYVISPAAPA